LITHLKLSPSLNSQIKLKLKKLLSISVIRNTQLFNKLQKILDGLFKGIKELVIGMYGGRIAKLTMKPYSKWTSIKKSTIFLAFTSSLEKTYWDWTSWLWKTDFSQSMTFFHKLGLYRCNTRNSELFGNRTNSFARILLNRKHFLKVVEYSLLRTSMI
jgi:hypothetical protein